MIKQASKLKRMAVWVFICGMYTHSLFTSYVAGRQRDFYLLLGLIPFVFLCWGLNILMTGKDLWRISQNLTGAEREERTRLAESYGKRMGMLIGGPLVFIYGFVYMVLGLRTILPYAVLFCFFAIIAAPFIVRQRRKMKSFMYSTEYALEQGYNKESANSTEATSQLASDAAPWSR